jgi:DNA-binding transcriptional MerR regulator
MSAQLPIHRPGLALVHGPNAGASSTAAAAEASRAASGRRTLRVGDLAKLTGKTVRALHLYEELALLEPLERSKGGFRLYDADAVVRVRFISKLQDLGFSLHDIRDLVAAWQASGSAPAGSAPGAMKRMREIYRQKLVETRQQIERLRMLEGELAASLDYLETCDTCDPARLVDACPRCEAHGCDTHAPDFVAGLHAS